jgi:hypothetical protein
MYCGVIPFEAACWLTLAGLLAALGYTALKPIRMTVSLWMLIGFLSLSWAEPRLTTPRIRGFTPVGDSVIDLWAQSHARTPAMARPLKVLGYVVFSHVVYLCTYLPHATSKYHPRISQTRSTR